MANFNKVVASNEANIAQELNDLKTKIASKTAALKAKLAQFKDQKKAEIADRINTNLNSINTKRTNDMLNNLNKMSVILDKLESRINRGSPDIKDPISAKAAVASAREIIASTSAKVQTQAQKNYTINITTETRVKTDVQRIRLQLQADLQTLKNQVVEAKQTVNTAIRIAHKEKPEQKEGTPSARE